MRATLTQLRILNISNNKLSTLTGIHTCTSMVTLDATHNQLRDVSHISHCLSIRDVLLEDNQLIDLPSLLKPVVSLSLFSACFVSQV